MVHDTRSMLDANAHAENPGHAIRWKIGPMPVLVGDENMLRQVWLNLLGNAVKYSARSEPAVIEISHDHEADGSHRFSVRDKRASSEERRVGKESVMTGSTGWGAVRSKKINKKKLK